MITPLQARSIASILSGRFKVKINESRDHGWSYNFKDNTIYYDKKDLKSLTDTDVIANLLHEVGHAKYSSHYPGLTWKTPVPEDHRGKLHGLCNVIEDFRIEDKVRDAYPYAIDFLPYDNFKTFSILNGAANHYRTAKQKEPQYLQYQFAIYSYLAYGWHQSYSIDKAVVEAVKKTRFAARRARMSKSTQEVLTIIEKDIYPYIKKMLDDYKEPPEMAGMAMLAVKVGHGAGDDSIKNVEDIFYNDFLYSIKPLVNPTAAVLNRLLTDNKFDRFEGAYRTGQALNERKLYKFHLGNYRLFQRKTEAKHKDYVFSLVVDESGSMIELYGDMTKAEAATKTAILFSQVLEKLGVPYSIHGFNAYLKTYKTADESFSMKTQKNFEKMYQGAWNTGNGKNDDGRAIHTFSKDMLSHTGKKVMFVLSDGYPAESTQGKKYPLGITVKQTERKGIEVIGVGILSDGVKHYYTNYIVVRELEDLPKLLLAQMKNKLRA